MCKSLLKFLAIKTERQKDRRILYLVPVRARTKIKKVLSICLSVFFEHACRWIPYTSKRVVFFLRKKSPLKIWKIENFIVSLHSYLTAVS